MARPVSCRYCKHEWHHADDEIRQKWKDNYQRCPSCKILYCDLPKTEKKLRQKVAGENKNVLAWKERYKNAGIIKADMEAVSESINPASKGAKNTEAYKAWKKRHEGVKIKE